MLKVMPEKNNPVTDQLFVFTSISLHGLMQDFSRISWWLVALSGAILVSTLALSGAIL